MSLMYTLRRWLDPDFTREESDRQRHHEQLPAPVPGGDGGPKPYRPVREPVRRRCRLCGREEWDTAYCTDCLAESMVEIPR